MQEMMKNDGKVAGMVRARLNTVGDNQHNNHVAMIYAKGKQCEIQI